MNVKELFENEELMASIVEDIEDIPEDSEVAYEVWALGRDDCGDSTETDFLIGEFSDPDEAIACAEKFNLETLKADYEKPRPDTYYFDIEVETVVADPDDEGGGTMNIGSIYNRDLWIDGEYGLEDYATREDSDVDPVVELTNTDFTITEEGELKISCELLKDFNKNDYIRIRFVDEAEKGTFLYRIISKVIYVDGDYYHCEMRL